MIEKRNMVQQLQELVQRLRVCYEVWPEYLMVDGKKVQVGFELELCGTHEYEGCQLSPECALCYQAYEDLRQIARWVVPKGDAVARCKIEPYDGALHETSKRRFRPEVILSIKILHRYDHSFNLPVDQCEEVSLKEMRRKLDELEVPEGVWTRAK